MISIRGLILTQLARGAEAAHADAMPLFWSGQRRFAIASLMISTFKSRGGMTFASLGSGRPIVNEHEELSWNLDLPARRR